MPPFCGGAVVMGNTTAAQIGWFRSGVRSNAKERHSNWRKLTISCLDVLLAHNSNRSNRFFIHSLQILVGARIRTKITRELMTSNDLWSITNLLRSDSNTQNLRLTAHTCDAWTYDWILSLRSHIRSQMDQIQSNQLLANGFALYFFLLSLSYGFWHSLGIHPYK